MTILIIEDDKLTLYSLKHIIESLGHKVTLAENAEEAIDRIAAGKFDLVISDIMMPGISGLSLVTILRTVYLCNTPIIVMSTLNNTPLLEAAYDAGANDFLSKPFSVKDLTEKIKKFTPDLSEKENRNT